MPELLNFSFLRDLPQALRGNPSPNCRFSAAGDALATEKQPICGVGGLVDVAIAKPAQKTLKFGVVGGRHLVGSGAAASADTLDASLESARDCMRRHAWDAPPQQNVKDMIEGQPGKKKGP